MPITDLTHIIPAAQIDPAIATDAEYLAADKAHIDAADPHLQYPTQARGDARYLRYFNSFEEYIPAPISLAANTWNELGSARIVGEQGKGSLWLVGIYFQYTDTSGGPNYAYYQYYGGGLLPAIFWEADLMANEGIEIPILVHNDSNFKARVRFGRGQLQKLEIFPIGRAISILSPGFGRISGVRVL